MNGLTFHCWLRLDNVSFHRCSNTFGLASYRRQLLQYDNINIKCFNYNYFLK